MGLIEEIDARIKAEEDAWAKRSDEMDAEAEAAVYRFRHRLSHNGWRDVVGESQVDAKNYLDMFQLMALSGKTKLSTRLEKRVLKYLCYGGRFPLREMALELLAESKKSSELLDGAGLEFGDQLWGRDILWAKKLTTRMNRVLAGLRVPGSLMGR